MKLLKVKKILLVFILVLTGLGLSIGINRHFIGHHDDNNQLYRLAAVNYIDKGILTVKFGQLVEDPKLPLIPANYYTHHPPLISLFLAISIFIFGDHFWSVRLVPIIFSLATLVVFYKLLRQYFDSGNSTISLLFWVITPMFLYFGKMADHEALTLFFIVLAAYGYVTRNSKLVLLSIFIGQWTGWPAYYMALILAIFMRSPALIILSAVDFILFLGHVFVLTDSPLGGGLREIFLFRTGATANYQKVVENYSTVDFLKQEFSWLYHFFTPPQFLISLAAVFVTTFNIISRKNKFDLKEKVWLSFLFVATVHVLLFRTGAHRHDYWLYYFLPFFSFGVAQAMQLVQEKVKRRAVVYAIFILLLLISFNQSQPFFWALQNRIEH